MFKYILLISFFSLVLCLTTIHTTFASDMKLYRNDNDHYSILIPSDLEYQDVNKIDDPNLQGLSLLAISKSNGMIYIQKVQQALFSPIENWTDNLREKFIQGVKKSELSKAATFKDSGEIDINNNKFLWIKFVDSTQEILLYSFVHNNSLYSIGYLYPINVREEILPKIKESINSLKFDDVSPNWYWIDSNGHNNVYIDTNNISSYKDPSTNIIYKRIIIKFTSSDANDNVPYDELITEFKTENNINYYRPIAFLNFGSNQKLLTKPFNFSPVNSEKKSINSRWSQLNQDNELSKIADLLFEKNQQRIDN